MARMTDEEADALDELWTRTTPEIDTSKPDFISQREMSPSAPKEVIDHAVTPAKQ